MHVVEMFNKKTMKRRVLACESAAAADDLVNLLNLVNSFLTYEQLLSKENSSHSTVLQQALHDSNINPVSRTAGGPLFLTNWVRTYLNHNGMLEWSEEFYETDNFPYLLAFGRESEAVKALVFGESLSFLVDPNEIERRI